MFKRIHFLIGVFMALYFLPVVENRIVFFPMVILASFVPDLDEVIFPKRDLKVLSPLKNPAYKNFMHSYTVCAFLAIVLVFVYPILALPFFIGYSTHLFFDSLTIAGISPFWPSKTRTIGFITPEGKIEKVVGVMLVIFILLLVMRYLF